MAFFTKKSSKNQSDENYHQPWYISCGEGRGDPKTKDRKILINIRGCTYETFHSTLSFHPDTLLGCDIKRRRFYNYHTKAYCFDVRPAIFDAILFYYQSRGILAKPGFVKEEEYTQALKLFGIIRAKKIRVRAHTLRQKLWKILSDPRSSKLGTWFAYISFAIVMVSVGMFCLETEIHREKPALYRLNSILFTLDCVFIGFLTAEYFLRLFSSPRFLNYAVSFLGVIDLVSFIPFYIVLLFTIFSNENLERGMETFIQLLRFIQILRVVKLSRYISGFRVLAKSLLACKGQMFSICSCFVIGTILSSNLLFVFENIGGSKTFDSIPSAMWFSVISMTTVGYGDVFPATISGKLCATIAILIGTVLLFHLFLPVYLMYFSLFYAKSQQELMKKWEAREKQTRHKFNNLKSFRSLARNSLIAEAEAQQITSAPKNQQLTGRHRLPSRVFSPASFLADTAVSPGLRKNSTFKVSF